MTFYKHSLTMVAVAACTSAASLAAAQEPRAHTTSVAELRGPTTAEVAGIRLHASPSEVITALAKAGYRITTDTQTNSFDQGVRAEAARRRGLPPTFPKQAGTGKMMATGPNQEYLEAEFMQTAAGSQVSSVSASVPDTAISAADFRRQLRSKYGEPDNIRLQGAEMSWCSPETMRNCGTMIAVSGPLDDQYPSVKASAYDSGGNRTVRLYVGESAFAALATAKEEAVRRLAPPVARASF